MLTKQTLMLGAVCIAVTVTIYLGGVGSQAWAAPPPNDSPAVTEFLEVKHYGRKHIAAERMSELHLEHYERGRQVIDVEPYVQGGDLQGFFITYVER